MATNSPILDSGYNSLSPNLPPTSSHSSSGNFREMENLTCFEHEVDKCTKQYFEDIVQRLRDPLKAALYKKGKPSHPMAIRLMVLGEDEESAKPCIVILCPKRVCKTVRKFLEVEEVRRLYQPKQLGLPNFDVYVHDRAPRLKATGDSIINTNEGNLVTRIRVDRTGEDRFATLGGLVVVIDEDKVLKTYGLTARHVLVQETIDQGDGSDISDDEDSCSPIWDSDIDKNEEDERRNSHEVPELPINVYYASNKDSGEGMEWWHLGHIAAASFSNLARNRDWALIEDIEDYARTNPSEKNLEERYFWGQTNEELAISKQKVEIRSQPPFVGSTSQLPAFVLLPFGFDFVRVHTITISKGLELPAGSSGSWVVTKQMNWPGDNRLDWPQDASQRNRNKVIKGTSRVLGQVIADDVFGCLYVVPLVDILEDIKDVLNAREARLPESNSEIENILRIESAQAETAVETLLEGLNHEIASLDEQQLNSPPLQASAGHTSDSRNQHEEVSRTKQDSEWSCICGATNSRLTPDFCPLCGESR